jgi:4-phosphopantoate--beta-alanine ligase
MPLAELRPSRAQARSILPSSLREVLTLTEIPKSHPRYASLVARERVAEGVKKGYTSTQGLIAQGRGECFDYLLGERTTASAAAAIRAGAALLLLAQRPAISVNGNVAALVPEEMVALARALNIPLEVNLFHRSEDRVKKIADLLREKGAEDVLGERPDTSVPGLDHARALATRGGIYDADVVLIPLEDGDRCEALLAMGKRVIAIDLNPLSRTAKKATVSIVDNILRAVPQLTEEVRQLSNKPRPDLEKILNEYDNQETLAGAVQEIRDHLDEQFRKGSD